jgi:hypothetical protein
VRAARSIAAGLVCVTAAAVGHRAAGGPLPAEAVLAAFAGSSVVAWLLSSRRVTPSQLLGLLVLCQVVVHLGASEDEMVMGASMVAGHVVATAVSVLALAHGEALVWRLARRLVLRAVPVLRAVRAHPSARAVVAVARTRSRRDVLLAHSRSLRGPPVSLV